ncbi:MULTISPECIES: alpha/beta hydrolase [unclassified Caballeronia]|uniref:alpha/beta hydrolase n=1 Tax=unclassified Caballeronia TaxID=2646786 RepID=UPI002027EC5A|nr:MULTISPECIES: alpha/beta hydrolase [unclassified Caballeronia]MDR5787356.1 alpha/beta hydrolase [Caballeronia sp. LP003]
MPLNPKIAQILEMVARANRPPYHTLTPKEARAAYAMSAQILDIAPLPVHAIEDLRIPVRDGATIGVRVYHPIEPSWAQPSPGLLYFHGGGFTVGSVATHDALCRKLAHDAQCAVVSVDYRLAPEHKFPVAVTDAFDALQWLAREAPTLGIDPARLAVGGDSAGGTLAIVCAVRARDAGIDLKLQLLIYPGTSAWQKSDSHARLADGYLLSGETIQWFFAQYLRDDRDRDDWRFAPLDAARGTPDFAGVAPAWIAAADYDPLHDEDTAFAAKLEDARVPVTLKRYEGMIHEFFKMGGFVPEVAAAHADAVRALREAFGTL